MEEDRVRMLLEGSLERLFVKLKETEPGSKEYESVINEIRSLYELRCKDAEIDFQYFEHDQKSETDLAIRQEQLKADKRRSIFEMAKCGLLILANGLWIRQILRFEETGTITSKTFGMIPKILKG